jgi:hypothetical protein
MNIRSGRPKRWVVIVVAIAVVFICGLIAVGPAYAPVKYGTVALIARFGKPGRVARVALRHVPPSPPAPLPARDKGALSLSPPGRGPG